MITNKNVIYRVEILKGHSLNVPFKPIEKDDFVVYNVIPCELTRTRTIIEKPNLSGMGFGDAVQYEQNKEITRTETYTEIMCEYGFIDAEINASNGDLFSVLITKEENNIIIGSGCVIIYNDKSTEKRIFNSWDFDTAVEGKFECINQKTIDEFSSTFNTYFHLRKDDDFLKIHEYINGDTKGKIYHYYKKTGMAKNIYNSMSKRLLDL